jgi:hypothetical protein
MVKRRGDVEREAEMRSKTGKTSIGSKAISRSPSLKATPVRLFDIRMDAQELNGEER